MADIRCPMCGKPNPAEATTCQYCQAQLKPVSGPLNKAAPDWLNTLRGDQSDAPAAPKNESQVPDWLSRIREQSQTESGDETPDWAAGLEAAAPNEAADLPDWLKGGPPQPPAASSQKATSLPHEDAAQPPSGNVRIPPVTGGLSSWATDSNPQRKEEDNDAWLQNLAAWQSFGDEAKSEGNVQPPVPPATPTWPPQNASQPFSPGSGDWISELREQATPAPGGETPPPGQNADLSDWLASLPDDLPQQPGSAASSEKSQEIEELPDWLSGAGQSPTAASVSQPSSGTDFDPSAFNWLEEPAGDATPASHTGVTGFLNSLKAQRPDEAFSGAPGEPSTGGETSSAGSARAEMPMPDWISSFDEETPSLPAEAAGKADLPPSDEIPDWLKSFEAELPAEDNAAAQPGVPSAPEESPDWLKTFGAEEQPAAAVPTPASEKPDWLQATAAETPAAVPAPAEEAPDWLKGFGAEEQPAAAVPTPASETPDWLRATAAPTPAEETPDWLKGFGAEEQPAAAVPTPASETPDWLQATAAETPAAAPTPAEEAPDWLKGFGAEEQPAAAAPTPASETPDWLQATAAETPAAVPAPAEEAPDWLKGFGAEEQPAAAAPTPASEMPDWLQASGPETPAAETPAIPFFATNTAALPTASEDIDAEWLKVFGGETAAPEPIPAESVPTAPPTSGVVKPPSGGLTTRQLEMSSDNIQPEESQTPPPPIRPSVIEPILTEQSLTPIAPFANSDLPDWLSEIEPSELELESTEKPAAEIQPGPEAAAEPVSPLAAETPAWLTEATETSEPAAAAPAEAEIEPGMMPQWLQAMRPVESVMGETTAENQPADQIEQAGPLAGLQGVLPTADVTRLYRKPATFSMKLRLSDNQRSNVGLLDSLVHGESLAQEIRPESHAAPQRILRLVVAAILIAVLLVTGLLRGGTAPVALSAPVEVAAFHQHIEALPAGSTVLVALDYEPGYSGEMDLAASAVLQRLITKNASLALVSTNPAGPVLGDNLLSSAFLRLQTNKPDQIPAGYQLEEKYTNLGYLPGGIVSLQEFALAPQLATHYGFASKMGQNVWDSPALKNVDGLQKFALVVVLADSPDKGRAWIEQVQSHLPPGAMLLVSTAQAAPLLQPYVNPQQAGGLLGGYVGGMAYQKLAGVSTSHNTHLAFSERSDVWWNAYQAGLFMGIAFVLLGILFQVIAFLGSRRKS